MKKFIFCLSCLFAFSSLLFASEDTFTFNLGNYKMSSLIILKMNHPKQLFKYDNKIELEQYLNHKDSNLSAINVFLIDTGKDKILFDTGTDANILTERLAELNIKPEDINYICITHMHFDHIGGLVKDNNKVFPNAQIFVSKEELDANPNSILSTLYQDKTTTFEQNEVIIDNIQTIPMFGHTKGHSAFLVSSEGKSVLIWGDMLHAVVQFKNSNIYMTYDANPKRVLELRKKVLQEYSEKDCLIAGSHLIYPGIGSLQKAKKGYKFLPLQ